jgi:uncharacterized protein HemY
LFQCLQQVGSPAEAKSAEERWRQCEADLKTVAELATAISRMPRDPDLRCKMGELFLRNGRVADGLNWLNSALREQPDHGPTHMALASHFEKTGQPDRAATHRALAAASTGSQR